MLSLTKWDWGVSSAFFACSIFSNTENLPNVLCVCVILLPLLFIPKVFKDRVDHIIHCKIRKLLKIKGSVTKNYSRKTGLQNYHIYTAL